MTIDIKLIRESPEVVVDSEQRRFRDPKTVNECITIDKAWIKSQYDTEQLKKRLGVEVKAPMKERKQKDKTDPCTDILEIKKKIEALIAEEEAKANDLLVQRDAKLKKIGNILCKTVPTGDDEDHPEHGNQTMRKWGEKRVFGEKYQTSGFRPHFELLEMIDGVNFEMGREVFGSRGYFLQGPAVILNQALISYGTAFLAKEGYTPVQPPFMMKADVMAKAAELQDYEETLYKVVDGQHEDKFLIATSEQPITALWMNKTIPQEQLPIRYAGISSCFRKEAGSSGRDVRGIFRCHQFEKVEQFCITSSKEGISQEEHEKIIRQAEKFYQSLEIPYRVVAIVSGEINDAASKKYDLEGWFPAENIKDAKGTTIEGAGNYRELVSASNCSDYQSRRMNTSAGYAICKETPHMLNSTLCATGRVMCAILENYQEKDGIRVPRVLQPFMAGMDFIPFLPKYCTEFGTLEGFQKKKKPTGDKSEL